VIAQKRIFVATLMGVVAVFHPLLVYELELAEDAGAMTMKMRTRSPVPQMARQRARGHRRADRGGDAAVLTTAVEGASPGPRGGCVRRWARAPSRSLKVAHRVGIGGEGRSGGPAKVRSGCCRAPAADELGGEFLPPPA
jgi:hypothetical protein